jgi:MFS family permease
MKLTLDRLGLPALAYGQYRIFFASNLVANCGIFVFMAAFGWFIQEETGSAAMVGLASAIMGLPWLLLMLHAGMLTDRLGAGRLLTVSLIGGGLVMALVGIVALMPGPSVAVVLAAAAATGVMMTIGAPGSVSIVTELVPPAAVSSAVGLNFLLLNVARILGGVGAGALLGGSRPAGYAILVAAALFALPGIPIWRLRSSGPRGAIGSGALFGPIVEAGVHAFRYPTLGMILLLSAGPGVIGLPYNFLLPVAASELRIGPEGLGILLAAAGTGGLVAGLAAEHIQRALGHGRSILLGLSCAAAGLVSFGLAPTVGIAIISMAFIGGGFVIYASASLTLVQALAPPSLRGRLTAVFSFLYWGLMPVGGLAGGLSAQAYTARTTMLAAGVVLVALGLLAVFRRPQILSLAVSRDGLRIVGDLAGTGVLDTAPGAAIALAASHVEPAPISRDGGSVAR